MSPTRVGDTHQYGWIMGHSNHRRFFGSAIWFLVAVSYPAAAQTQETQTQIVALFEQAQQAEQAENLSSAATFYRKIVSLDPNIAEVWSNLGMALYRQDQFKESVVAFDRAATLKPALLAPHVFGGIAHLKLGEAEKAVGPLKSALAIEPYQPEATLALSEAYAKTRQFDASVRLLRKALERDPDSESLGSNLAVTYLDWAKDIGSALRRSPGVYGRLLTATIHAAIGAVSTEEDLRAIVAVNPGSVEARLALARFLIETQPTPERLRESDKQIEAARKISSEDLEVSADDVRLAVARDDLSRAFGLLQNLAQEDPEFTLTNLDALASGLPAESVLKIKQQAASMAASSNRSPNSYSSKFAALERVKSKRLLTATEDAEYASTGWHLHRYDEALSELVSRHRTDDQSLYWIFRVCKARGREVLEQTVNAHPDSVPSHLLLADFAVQRDDYREAKSEFETALALRPHDPDMMLRYVRMLETARETKQAQDEATRDATEFPLDAGLNFEAGELTLRSSGDAEAAVKYLERALQTDPGMVRARVDLADAYEQLQRLDDAIHEVERIAGTDDDGTLHYRLARWYRQTGRGEEAAKALESCKRIKEQKLKKETISSIERSGQTNHDSPR